MIFESEVIKIKDTNSNEKNFNLILRAPNIDDAHNLNKHIKEVIKESDFLLRYEEEYKFTDEQEANLIESILSSDNDLMIVAEINNEIIGTLSLNIKNKIKIKHRASIGLAVRKKYWGIKIGYHLIKKAIEIAKNRNIIQIELEYIEGNKRGVNLYNNLGFKEVGRMPRAIILKDGRQLDEISMVLFID